MATKKTDKPEDDTVKVRVLFTGTFGKINDVVLLDKAQAEAAQASGDVDAHAEAVAYAESLTE